jgi:hypothetical protein
MTKYKVIISERKQAEIYIEAETPNDAEEVAINNWGVGYFTEILDKAPGSMNVVEVKEWTE